MQKHNKDNRDDNVENIQKNITCTIQNIRKANDLISMTSDNKLKQTLKEKNDRRRTALEGMKKEIKEEAIDRSKRREDSNDEPSSLK